MATTRTWVSLFILCAVFIGGSGCGGNGDRPELGYVTGTVTMDGKPFVGVIINFKPEEGRPATATTGDDGEYELTYRYGVKGTKTGLNTVNLAWPTGEEGSIAIPEQYSSKSILKETVKAGNNTFNFDLKSK